MHRLLARLTEYAEVQSGEAARYPEYAKRSARGDGYQIEHIWANHPERFEDEFDHPTDFAAYRNRIGGLILLPGPDNASYSNMTFEEKVEHYAKQNLQPNRCTQSHTNAIRGSEIQGDNRPVVRRQEGIQESRSG